MGSTLVVIGSTLYNFRKIDPKEESGTGELVHPSGRYLGCLVHNCTLRLGHLYFPVENITLEVSRWTP